MKLERGAGIEPASSAWKAPALPLSYPRLVVGGRRRSRRSVLSDFLALCLCLGRSGTPQQGRIATTQYTNIEAEAKAVISTAIHPCHFRQSIRFDVGPGLPPGRGVDPLRAASLTRSTSSSLPSARVFSGPSVALRAPRGLPTHQRSRKNTFRSAFFLLVG